MLLLSCCLSASNPCLSTGLYDAEADIQLTTLFPGPADFLFGSVHSGAALEEDLNTGGEGLLLACFPESESMQLSRSSWSQLLMFFFCNRQSQDPSEIPGPAGRVAFSHD